MLPRSNRFICHFLILFLVVLLAMFGMYYVLKGAAKPGKALGDAEGGFATAVERVFKVNLFVIDLCVLVIAETVLIFLFVRFTLPSVGITSFLLIFVLLVKDVPAFRARIDDLLSPFIGNKFAYLDRVDAMVLILINTLILAFLLTVLIKEEEFGKTALGAGGKRDEGAGKAGGRDPEDHSGDF